MGLAPDLDLCFLPLALTSVGRVSDGAQEALDVVA
jgi:hypothetical protein